MKEMSLLDYIKNYCINNYKVWLAKSANFECSYADDAYNRITYWNDYDNNIRIVYREYIGD